MARAGEPSRAGLSTDYGVFLLARIKEARDGGYGDSEAVAVGLERTGRIVTAAALLFAVAFGAFLTSEIIITKHLGLGTAIAVLIDASIIRALLVPALMQTPGTLELVGAGATAPPARPTASRPGMTASEAHQPGAGRRAPAIKAVVVTALAVPLALAAAPVCIGAALWVSADVDTVGDSRFERELWIPPLLDPHADRAGRKVFELDLREGSAELLPGTTTATLWYHPHLWAGPRTTSTAGSPGRS